MKSKEPLNTKRLTAMFTARSLFVVLAIIGTTQLNGQVPGNQYARLTKKEFKELLAHRDSFVPSDLGDTVIIVKYSGERHLEMQTKARLEPWSTDLTKEQISKRKKNANKFASKFPEKLRKDLKKKNKASIIVEEKDLRKSPVYLSKYWLKTIYISDRESVDNQGWVMTVTNMFYDPKMDKHFEIFLPMNYRLIDMVNTSGGENVDKK